MKILKILLTVITILYFNSIFGQISQGGEPYSFSSNLKNKQRTDIVLSENIPFMKMQKIDNEIIEEIKRNNETQDESYQFAYSFFVDINLKSVSIIDSLNVGLLYRYSIKSDGAYSINLIFKNYLLPKGAKLFLYSKDKQHITGAFTSNNNKASGRLATLPVKGEEIIIEYFEPYYSEFKGKLVIEIVSHDFFERF